MSTGNEAVLHGCTDAGSEPTAGQDTPSVQTIRVMIEEAAAIVRAAEERRAARGELRALIESIEREAGLATTEEDYAAADWLKKEARRLRKSAFGAIPAIGKSAQSNGAQQPAQAAPRPVPVVAPVREAPSAPVVPAGARGDLAHWFSRWAEVEAQLSVDDGQASRRHALDARAVMCGIQAYIVRESDDPSCSKSLREARDLRTRVDTRLKTLGWPWEAPLIRRSGYDERTRAAHIRRLSDGYCRAALAFVLWNDGDSNQSAASEASEFRMRVALSTMRHLQGQLRLLGVSDELVDHIVRDMERDAAELGVEIVSPTADDEETPPYTSGQISQLIGSGRTQAELIPEGKDPRDAAIESILALARSRETFGADPDRMDEDRAAMLPLLDEAFRLGVPQSNRAIRDELLDRWPSLLDGQSNYTVFLREVSAEIARRSAADDDRDEAAAAERVSAASDVEKYVCDLRPILEGKRMLLLGGVPRIHTAPKLQEELGLHEVMWPEAKKNDTPDKFESDMRRADVIVIVKNYSRHAASQTAAEIARETGSHCVMLPAGYGVARIIAQLHSYFETRGMIGQQA